MHGRARCDAVDEIQVEALLLGEHTQDEPERTCRMCFDSAVAPGDRLLSPCQCRGTMKYVHASCLDEWRAKSRRTDSARMCEQCGTAYKFRATPVMRLLASRFVRVILSILLLLLLSQALGVMVRVFLQQNEPALFEAMHPWAMQSISYEPGVDTMPWPLPPDEREITSVSMFWDDVLGSVNEPDTSSHLHLYILGLAQPLLLLQSVQGMLQRTGESLVRGLIPRITQRVVTVHGLPIDGAASYALRGCGRCTRLYEHTLGLAIIGLSMNSYMLGLLSSLHAFYAGVPFTVVAMYPIAGSPTHVAAVRESDQWLGPLLLAMVLGGLLRAYCILYQHITLLGQYITAHTPRVVVHASEPGITLMAPPRPAPRAHWTQWVLQRMVRGHAAMRDVQDPRFVWMLAQAGD